MKLSVFMFLTDETIGPSELAVAAEERGFAGLWVPEHPHVPTARRTPVPPAYGGGELHPMYLRLLDPFVALTAAALATTRLRVGTGICLLALRDPIVTAKAIATLDHLSGGRFDFGVGYGWNADEFPNHGQDFADRHTVVRDKLAVMRALWSDDVAEVVGGGYPLEPSWAWPKPAQRPGPPIWLGGNGPTTMREAARWADVWYPTPSSADLAGDVARFRGMLEEEGRADAVGVGLAATPGDGSFLSHAQVMEVDEVSVALPSAPAADVLPVLDALVATRDRLGI
jgi:probable F420-dependent oxidoreductase